MTRDRDFEDQRTRRIVVYADFNCPWSYLASRRAAILAEDGLLVDWRAVEHDPWRPSQYADRDGRFACLREEMDRVLAQLLPDEELPYSLAGFLPFTQAAISAYAEAYASGVAARSRQLLFDAFWMHGLDLNDPKVVRTLLVDAIRSGFSASEPLRRWGYAVDNTGGPVTATAWRLIARWRDEWLATGKETVPVLLVNGIEPVFGVDALEWLGAELRSRGLTAYPVPTVKPLQPRRHRDVESLTWVSQHGNRWMRAFQDAHRLPLFPDAS